MGLVVISNRVPLPTGDTSAGGLTVAVQDALARSGGIWFGWDGDRATGRASAPDVQRHDDITFATVPLAPEDLENYYRGYANSVLWPLLHEHLDAIDYRDAYRTSYLDVNRYFARSVRPSIDADDTVWIHDYHLIPLAAELRRLDVTSRIGFFLHIPFPPFDLLRALPDAAELLESFFAYDLAGFQTAIDARHFAGALRRGLGAMVNETLGVAEYNGHRLRFGAYPIGIDVDGTAETAAASRNTPTAMRLVEALQGRKLVIGADRLDYTKGLVKRIRAFGRLLEQHEEELDDRLIYVQVAAPSREEVDRYQVMARELEREAGRVNGLINSAHWAPLRLITRAVPREVLLGYFSIAHVGLVTPLRDGMNLVAKEFLAAQPPEDPGVLVLSSLAGAAEELAEAALIVNPYDAGGVADALYEALHMPLAQRLRRWEIGMESLQANTAAAWRERFLSNLIATRPRTERGGPRPRPPHRRPRRPHEPSRASEASGGSSTTSAA